VENADDKQLLAWTVDGNQQAFKLLMQRHIKAISAYAFQILKNKSLAEEICQETFLRVWQKSASWTDQGYSVKSWIYKICYNLCIDLIRKQDKERKIKLETQHRQDSISVIEPVHHIQYEQVLYALQTLPERQANALILNAFQGLNNTDAAQVMDVSIEALESLLARARRKLKQLLIEQENIA